MKRTENETMGMRIRNQRVLLGMTQEELGEVLCIPKATISAYENDNIDFKASRLADLAKALYSTPNFLLGVDDCEKDENREIAETIVAIMGRIKDEKVCRLLLEQIKVAASFYA